MLPSLSLWSDVLKIIIPVIVASGLGIWANRKLEHLKKDIQNMLAVRARRTDFLRSQIEKLYGPLSFYLDLNSQNLALHADILRVDTSSPQLRLTSKEIDQVITAINLYARRTTANNEAIADLLRAQWAWLDTDDGEVMIKHVFAHIRSNVEFDLANNAKLPLDYYREGSIKPPTVHSTDLADRIRKKLQDKQLELSGLVSAVTTTRDEH
ncbi:hypothetical protein [Stigmatella erecta]|nr:hypothetical protein [Stigmatella erecta]